MNDINILNENSDNSKGHGFYYDYVDNDQNKKRKISNGNNFDGNGNKGSSNSGTGSSRRREDKPKLSRGSRACLVCRRVKMRCIGADDPPCKRCRNGGHQCIFEESNRGRKSIKKQEALNKSLNSMESTLDNVLKSISNPHVGGCESNQSLSSPSTSTISIDNQYSNTLNNDYNNDQPSTSNYVYQSSPVKYQVNYSDLSNQIQQSIHGSDKPKLNHQAVKTLEKLINGTQYQQLEAANWINQFQESLIHYNNHILQQQALIQKQAFAMNNLQKPPHLRMNTDNENGVDKTKTVTALDQLVNAFEVTSPKNGKSKSKHEDALPPHMRSPKLHSLPDNTLNPLGLLAEASLNNRKYSMKNTRPDIESIIDPPSTSNSDKPVNNNDNNNDTNKDREDRINKITKDYVHNEGIGVASGEYYRPGPMSMLPLRRIFIERQNQPEILRFCTDENIQDLFNIYCNHLNIHTCILDPEFHTPQLVASRSPFLLTAICAVSSKFYTKDLSLQSKLNNIARKLAFDVPSQGFKSVEIVMAYLILVYWGVGPSRRFEEDKTWLLLGLGLRVATDLNLHRKSTVASMPGNDDVQRERELRIRERAWILCYITDRSLSAQMGKPASVALREDYIIRNVSDWALGGHARDYCIASYCELQRIVSRSIDFLYSSTVSPSGLTQNINYVLITLMFESQLIGWLEGVIKGQELLECSEEQRDYIIWYSKFMGHYWLLALFSFGLQSSLDNNDIDLPYFFSKCYHFAIEIINITKNELAPRGWLKYSVDSHFVFITYACVSLLKFMRPQFKRYHSAIAGLTNTKILDQVTEITSLLAEIAVDAKHTPALYSAFLQALISAPNEEDENDYHIDSLNYQRQQQANRNEIYDKLTNNNYNVNGNMSNGYGVPIDSINNDNNNNDINNNVYDQTISSNNHNNDNFNNNDNDNNDNDNDNVTNSLNPILPPPSEALNEYSSNTVEGGFESTNIDYISMDLKALNEQAAAMDALYQNGFWDNVLLPGFGGPLDSISGGVMRSGFLTPRAVTPSQTPRILSRPQSPHFPHQYLKAKSKLTITPSKKT